jgi:adenosylcobinamide-GDP ribazoletransferase
MNKKPSTNPFLFALSMLTRIPVKTGEVPDSAWKWISASFAECGYIIGAVAAAPAIVLPVANIAAGKYITGFILLPGYAVNLISALLFVILTAWMTRLFHLDGFCDSCDAFSAVTESKERRLEIMKDPHPGAVAVCTSSLLLLSKTILIFLIIQRAMESGDLKLFIIAALPALIAVPVFARFAMTTLAAVGKYPRSKGTGKTVIENTTYLSVIIGLITVIPVAILITPYSLISAAILILITIFYWKRKADKLLGGVTGDILGACCETAECAAALGLLLALH